jgi:hypothetical protein
MANQVSVKVLAVNEHLTSDQTFKLFEVNPAEFKSGVEVQVPGTDGAKIDHLGFVELKTGDTLLMYGAMLFGSLKLCSKK